MGGGGVMWVSVEGAGWVGGVVGIGALRFRRAAAFASADPHASYGTDEETRAAQARDIRALAAPGHVHFPVPADGRGLEMAVDLHDAGIPVAIDDALRATLRRLSGPDRAFGKPAALATAAVLAEAAAPAELDFPGAILTADAIGDGGTSAKLIAARGEAGAPMVVFTGHLDVGTTGHRLVAEGRAGFRRWNVHPSFPRTLRSRDPSEPKSSSPPSAERSTGLLGARHFPQPNSCDKSISDPSQSDGAPIASLCEADYIRHHPRRSIGAAQRFLTAGIGEGKRPCSTRS